MIYNYDDILRRGYSMKLYIVDGNGAYEINCHSNHIDISYIITLHSV